jgi:tetratricopeptide (TPR) repeat protein
MFEFARELRRMFASDGLKAFSDGLTGGDAALLELLDLNMLTGEGKAADVAAGRIGAKDKPQRRLEAAIVWREIARRSGDAATLRKAAASAEIAAAAFDRNRRPDGWARARCEQAYCAMLGAELFGDDGLNAAAEVAFREARAATRGGLAAALADIGIAAMEARLRLADGDAQAARVATARFASPIAALEGLVRRCAAARPLAAEARIIRADLLAGWGARLKDRELLEAAMAEAARAAARLDPAYEPLTWSRAEILRAQAMILLGETTGDVDRVAEAVSALADVLDHLSRDHSPLDWARVQVALGQGLQALGDASASERAYEQAVTCYDRADVVLRHAASAPLRGVAAGARAVCLIRSAELTGDVAVLDAAEMAMKIELSRVQARRDPVGWALAQIHLARLYEARLDMTGKDRGERASAVTALDAALDVFAEHGLRSLSMVAVDALERLKAGPRRRPRAED